MGRIGDGLEQRHILGSSSRYENRFRYMLRAGLPRPFDHHRYYVGLYDEVFYNFVHAVAYSVFERNRAYLALGRNMSHQTLIEAGFLEQTLQHRDGKVFEHNHTLQVAVYSRLPFSHH